ncbi:putative leucine-rich repeat receptor-like protein kinase isoform X1 [Iris pallida]|uniref:Leucine-rich repeat receptor-like protein kinase isoform X1 n=1 Tax=Iris pallida TaxID=29817 RepID=A0AAX6E232_IRIPA|nr:putative leucine-rich repeat receptor-like protein kinase isoform X1 [Iris pallida]
MKRWYAPCAFLFLFLVVVVHGAGDDSETMHALSLLFPPSSTKWNTTNPNPCKWNGVNCTTTTTQVLSLSLSGFGLSNASELFFLLLCKLTSLRSLDLSLNSLSSIPAPFLSSSDTCTGLSHLTSLNLSSNNLAGPLPNLSATFAALETLDLSANHLEGEVGPQLSALNSLKALSLANNLFTGAIPPLPDGLRQLVLSFNSFTGSIPNATLLNLKNLTLLDLASNRLSGPIPDVIGELSNLKRVQLSANRLSGEIPVGLASIASLRYFGANQNWLSRTIPPGLTRYVTNLDLSYNKLSGQIPPDLLSPPALLYVDLSYNRLGGTIPANVSSGLYRLRLSGNFLGGTVPTTIGSTSSSSLTYLELDNNKLDGEIPRQLGDCRNLTLLNLAGNRLRGTLPKELGNLKEMVIIYLQDNHLTGGIPKELLRLGQLITLNISRNFLSGAIPPEISSLQKLTRLNLEGNGLNGSIPETINALPNLIELQLGNNKLNGVVPRMPIRLSLALNLSSNSFAGPIPSYLASLQQLEILDLSNNEFSGQVPSSLILMQSLTQLVLSNNRLSGTFPTFPSYVHVNAAGNKDLVFPSPPAPGASSKRKSSRVLIVVVAIVSAVIGLGLAAAVLLLCVSNRVYRVEDQVEDAILQLEERPPQIISGCFLTSNSIHKSNIDFIRAMEVARSPSNITLKTRFSTYYRAEMPSGMKYSVKKLNWSEKIFQMGSPERFGQELEVLGRLSNSNLMVPLAYVLTEDDAYLFYESVHEGTLFDLLHKGSESSLDWQSRYSIALGVAQGLSFLHGCVQPVLLMDLSTKSIHLKSKSEPQIGDIELCKVIDPSKSTGNLSTVAGSVGYIPPEYAYTMRVTMSANVYSFGVILLELLTGKPPVSHGVELAKWASSFSGKLGQEQILDSSVCGTSPASRSQMMSVLKVALSCVSSSPDARPKMRNVSSMLLDA